MGLFAGVRRFLERGPMSEIEFRDQTAVVGVGYSRSPEVPGGFSRRSGVSVLTLAVRAALDACNDAGIDPSELDGGACWGFNDTVAPQQLLHSLQAKEVNYNSPMLGGGGLSHFAVVQAAQAVYHGICKYAIVFRAMNGRSGVRMGQFGGASYGVGARSNKIGGPSQLTAIYGYAGAPHIFAMEAQRWMDLYGVHSSDLANFCVNARSNAVKNPRATMREPISVDDHQNSRMIVHPYHLLDCCLETDVACAMIVTTAERAKDLKKTPVLISAGIGGLSRRPDITDNGFPRISPRLMEAAGTQLSDMDFYEAYDNFTDNPMRAIEGMGFCKFGEVKDFIKDGRIALDGELPMQTHGGLMNEGYAHGINNITEAVQQLRWDAEDLCPNWQNAEHTYDRSVCRQVKEPRIGLSTAVTGASGLVLKRGD